MTTIGTQIKKLLPLGLLALACAMPAQAMDVGGVNVADTSTMQARKTA